MHVLHEPARAGGTPVLVGALLRPPSRDESVLRSAETVLQPGMLGLLAVVVLFPAFPLGQASLPVPGIAVPVHARAIIRRGVEVDDGLRNVGQQRAIVADDDDTAVPRLGAARSRTRAASVEVVGGLIEQEEVVDRRPGGTPAHPITLSHREVCEKPGRVGFRVERFERDLHAPFGIPRIERFGMFQRGGVLAPPPGPCCPRESRAAASSTANAASGSAIASATACPTVRLSRRSSLVRLPDRADALDCSAVRDQSAARTCRRVDFPARSLPRSRHAMRAVRVRST
jgi:hypothetical protein